MINNIIRFSSIYIFIFAKNIIIINNVINIIANIIIYIIINIFVFIFNCFCNILWLLW